VNFSHPYFLLLIPLIMLLWAFRFWRRRQHESVFKHSDLENWNSLRGSLLSLVKLILPEILWSLALIMVVIALARPVESSDEAEIKSEGIDMVLCLDVSGSMLAQDLKPDRLEAAKKVAAEFISARQSDRIGLVVFSAEAFTQCPLTLDHDVLTGLLSEVTTGKMEDGTAVGLALATGLNRLKDSQAKSRVLILLTDGENNRGIDPRTAMDLAAELGITVHTIGVGGEGLAEIPVDTPWGRQLRQMEVHIDEELLREIAATCNGKYFRARDLRELKEVYQEIDRLEKSEIMVTEYRVIEEKYGKWLLAAVLLLVLEQFLRVFIRRLPA
jgi:Ca-activated chloride channel homolog